MMKRNNIKYYLGLALSLLVIGAAAIKLTTSVVEATSATTYTYTYNADNINVKCQDGYLPETTYDRIGLVDPQDMVIDTYIEDGKEVEYGYILNKNKDAKEPFILQFRLDDLDNSEAKVNKYYLKNYLDYVENPTGLWINNVTVNGITTKELYIADGGATFKVSYEPNEQEKELGLGTYTQTYNGLIYRIPFANNTQLDFANYDYITEPMQEAPRDDYDQYELVETLNLETISDRMIIQTSSNFESETKDTSGNTIYRRVVCKLDAECEPRIVPLGQYMMRTPSFGQNTVFNPVNVAVDTSGNIFVASSGTSAGMIQLSYNGEFVSFFVVNKTTYDALYQFIRKYGTKEQLEMLTADQPPSFSNVFVDNQNLVYSVTPSGSVVFDKYSTAGSSILNNKITITGDTPTDAYICDDGLMFLSTSGGGIIVLEPSGSYVFYFGFSESTQNILGFFKSLPAITVDSNKRIWALDGDNNYLQTFTPTEYATKIFEAIIAFSNHEFEKSRSAWEEVLAYDSLSVLANDGLGKAFYYDHDFEHSLQYFSTSKNRALYSNVFWELRNDYLQRNLATIFITLASVIVVLIALVIVLKRVKKLAFVRGGITKITASRVFKDLTVGFRMIKKPNDTFYELKTHKRGSVFGATIYLVLGIFAIVFYRYGKALPFQYVSINLSSPSFIILGLIAVIAIFMLCNYLVSAINDGEGKFVDIYKFTGYCMLPLIICLPLAVGISYGLTLNEQVIITILTSLGWWGSGLLLVIGILETHNYTFGKTVKNIILTIVFMVLFIIIVLVVMVMLDQISTFIETIWKEVKLRAGWY